ncbi:MAG: NADH pyrophosphatase zinc ribbon domain-containing protein [Acidimicrobiales bacterium]
MDPPPPVVRFGGGQDWALAGRAAQIVNWDRDHRYCGRCATPTDAHAADRARVCPKCGPS